MQEAHTIVHVPQHIDRVPAYTRKHFNATPKVRIGAAYQPRIQIQPAVFIYKAPRSRKATAAYWVAGALLLFALCWLSTATAATGMSEHDKSCVNAANIVQFIADQRDQGTKQTDLIQQTLNSSTDMQTQLYAIRMIDRIYNDKTFSSMPAHKLSGAVLKACIGAGEKGKSL